MAACLVSGVTSTPKGHRVAEAETVAGRVGVEGMFRHAATGDSDWYIACVIAAAVSSPTLNSVAVCPARNTRHAIAERRQFLDVGAGDEDRQAIRFGLIGKQTPDVVAGTDVDPARRVLEHQ